MSLDNLDLGFVEFRNVRCRTIFENYAVVAPKPLAAPQPYIRKSRQNRPVQESRCTKSGRRVGLKNQSFSVRKAPGASEDEGRELAAIHHTRIDRIEIGPRVDTDLETLRHALACAIPVSFVDGRGSTCSPLE
jgi:hypothetical protein